MLTPKDVKELEVSWLERITDLIDKEIINNHTSKSTYEYAKIDYKLSKEDRDTICKAYLNAGWQYAYHALAFIESEFILSMEPVNGLALSDRFSSNSWTEIESPRASFFKSEK